MDQPTSLTHLPGKRWVFDETVAGCFDDMLARSIPQYRVMREAVFALACRYARKDTDIVDLGCSRGEGLAPLIDKFGVRNRYLGIDSSEPMLEACRERFKGWINTGVVRIQNMDLRERYPVVEASVTLAVLTLQFVPLEYRQQVVAEAFRQTVPGGCFILVEKVLGEDASLTQTMTEHYLTLKESNGYSRVQIDAKRKSLEGVLVPVTARWNEDLLRTAGFQHVDCFWRWMNFAGWVGTRELGSIGKFGGL